MKIACISDLHGILPPIDHIPAVDILLIAGDICPNFVNWRHSRDIECIRQAGWLNTQFRVWLSEVFQKAQTVIITPGNHDFVFESLYDNNICEDILGITLIDELATFGEVNIYGAPWQPIFHNWAFNLSEPELAKKWAAIPNNTNILLLHGPPISNLDRVFGYADMRQHTGSPSLIKRIHELPNLKYVFCGHIHESRGIERLTTQYRTVIMENCSYLDDRYRPWYPPVNIWQI